MPGKSTEVFVEDAAPSTVGARKDVDLRISATATERVRLCNRAADMRAQHRSYREIAVELDLSSPAAAKMAVDQALAWQPVEDLRALRRLHAMSLARAGREALARVEDPGPLVSQGKIMYNEETGEPFPDNGVRIQALQTWIKLLADERKFHGTDAPKRQVNLTGEIPTEYLQAQLAAVRAELGIEGDQLQALEGAVLPPG
jgi:hypothetical protein